MGDVLGRSKVVWLRYKWCTSFSIKDVLVQICHNGTQLSPTLHYQRTCPHHMHWGHECNRKRTKEPFIKSYRLTYVTDGRMEIRIYQNEGITLSPRYDVAETSYNAMMVIWTNTWYAWYSNRTIGMYHPISRFTETRTQSIIIMSKRSYVHFNEVRMT